MKNLIKTLTVLLCVMFLYACESSEEECGVCKSAPVDAYYTGECFDDWDKETCDDFNARRVNGTTWSWIPDGTCY